jgi:tRNA-2-methylthio-N6-dimethylallyladenosine synthase
VTPPILPRSKELRVLGGGRGRPAAGRAGSLVAPAMGSEPGERPTFFVETYGCEMNDYDSEFIASRFLEEGYAPAPDPGSADVLLFNTCSVRQGAEDRVRARVRSFAGIKRARPGMRIGVVGCMAQRLGEELSRGEEIVDLVAGVDTYRRLPELARASRAAERGARMVETRTDDASIYAIRRHPRPLDGPCAFLTIMQGCDKFCTFCIVPYTRGRERSKPRGEVVSEAELLVARGAKQITLLGQNVNSYKDGDVGFAALLRALDGVSGLERVHFTSSYPRDMSEDVLRAVAEGRTPIEFLHFPVQSGSDRILRRMKRRHTADWYRRRVDLARAIIPDLQLSTDLIVGFPGETEEDFRATLALVEETRFAEAYMYKYSPREGTPATRLPDELSEAEKSRRLAELISLQRRIGREILEENVGRRMEVLVEGPSKRDRSELFGRTRNRFMVVLPAGSASPGDLVDVELSQLNGSTYRGIPVGAGEAWVS